MSIKNEYLGFLNSSCLWKEEDFLGLSPFDFNELTKTDIQPDFVEIYIRENEVLGKRVEYFFDHCITNSNRYTVLAKNIQVFRDKITIGELDFIIRDYQSDMISHIELVYKFYLYDPTIDDELHRWVGPNRKDTLLQKIEKIKTKQLPLLYKNETLPILEDLHIKPENVDQRVCYIANLFVPLSMRNRVFPFLNNQCIVGFWLTLETFTAKEYGSYTFNIPRKKDWIIHPEHCSSWFSFIDIIEDIRESISQKKSPMLWMRKEDDSYERFFIVWW